MTDYLYFISQTKLAEYYDTRTDLPIRKYVLIANLLKKTSTPQPFYQVEKSEEEQWLDTCLDALNHQEENTDKYNSSNSSTSSSSSITITQYSFQQKTDKSTAQEQKTVFHLSS